MVNKKILETFLCKWVCGKWGVIKMELLNLVLIFIVSSRDLELIVWLYDKFHSFRGKFLIPNSHQFITQSSSSLFSNDSRNFHITIITEFNDFWLVTNHLHWFISNKLLLDRNFFFSSNGEVIAQRKTFSPLHIFMSNTGMQRKKKKHQLQLKVCCFIFRNKESFI